MNKSKKNGIQIRFQKIDPYDWFCGPGAHITINRLYWERERESEMKYGLSVIIASVG